MSATTSQSERVYVELKQMAISFQLQPNERINEADLATKFGVSRTPLREALNRLTTEGLLTFQPGRGFFCRPLIPRQVFDLYELRATLESSSVAWAVQRAKEPEIEELRKFLAETGPDADGRTTEEMVALDEHFHEGVARLSGNSELLSSLQRINERIRFVRWVNMGNMDRPTTQAEHMAVLDAIAARDEAAGIQIIQQHVSRRMDEIVGFIKEGLARIYVRDIDETDPSSQYPST